MAGADWRGLGGFDVCLLDLDEGSRDAVSLSATDGRGFAVGLLDAMSYAIRQSCAVLSLWIGSGTASGYRALLVVMRGSAHIRIGVGRGIRSRERWR